MTFLRTRPSARYAAPTNLNLLSIPTDGTTSGALEDFSCASDGVTVYLRNIERELIKQINAAEVVVGCVAWLTSFPILDALAATSGASIIVQKEDMLRPDIGSRDGSWRAALRARYNAIGCLDRWMFGKGILGGMSYNGDTTLDSVRCVGNHNKEKNPAFPRMHNKFILLCSIEKTDTIDDFKRAIVPYAVWTGSFNFTKNAGYSFENALFITIPEIVQAYFKEYQQIAALSEPLDWESDWVYPEWRIGT